MATATAKKPRKKGRARAPGKEPVIQFPVQLGSKSTGDKTISIGAKIDRQFCTLARMDECLVQRRLQGTLKVGKAAAEQAPGQGKLPGLEDVDHEVTATIETSGVSVKEKNLSVTLNFNLKEVGEQALEGFSKRTGLLVIDEIGELADDDDELDADPEEGDAEE